MYSKYSNIVNVCPGSKYDTSSRFKFKQYHHVRLDSEFKLDCKVWLEFLQGNLNEVVNRPMVDVIGHPTDSMSDLSFFSDTSAAENLGMGAVFNTKWLKGKWGANFIKEKKPSIEYVELFALCVGVLAWQNQPELCNARITIFCDNIAIVHMINNITSSCKN